MKLIIKRNGGNMMNKIFFFDIDGTLAIRHQIPESNLKALKLLKDKGYLTFICTGRAPFYAQNLFKDLTSGIISCNGRYISYQGQKLYGKAFTSHELKEYKSIFHNLDCGCFLVSDHQSCVNNLTDQQIQEVQDEYGKDKIIFDESHLSFYTFDLFYQNLEHRDQIIEALKDKIIFNDHGGHGSGDCSTLEFDKGSAIAYLLDYFHISKNHAYAFGDGYNDQAMFREVNHKIAMGNAVDELKQLATFITTNVDDNGIMNALKHENIL